MHIYKIPYEISFLRLVVGIPMHISRYCNLNMNIITRKLYNTPGAFTHLNMHQRRETQVSFVNGRISVKIYKIERQIQYNLKHPSIPQ